MLRWEKRIRQRRLKQLPIQMPPKQRHEDLYQFMNSLSCFKSTGEDIDQFTCSVSQEF